MPSVFVCVVAKGSVGHAHIMPDMLFLTGPFSICAGLNVERAEQAVSSCSGGGGSVIART